MTARKDEHFLKQKQTTMKKEAIESLVVLVIAVSAFILSGLVR